MTAFSTQRQNHIFVKKFISDPDKFKSVKSNTYRYINKVKESNQTTMIASKLDVVMKKLADAGENI